MTSKRFGAGYNFPSFSPPSSKPILTWDPDNPASFLDLIDTINTYSGHAGKAVIVRTDESGLTVSTIAFTSDKSYTHVQGSSQTTWVISHGLAKRPAVMITDTGGHQIIADVEYISDNQVNINFAIAAQGVAYLN